jgi:2-keto-4-pentenoate hydratase/2-oxohepta-3-ene-1,7-dioic acid hydratase in catechol pathway
MKLIRWGETGEEKPGLLLHDGTRLDVSHIVRDYDEEFFGDDGFDTLRRWLDRNESTAPRASSSIRLGPPISRPSKIVCIGVNYRKHVAESGADVPREPVVFMKATSSLIGPNDPVVIPKNAKKLDWEVELAVVMGKKATYVTKEEALEFVAGYTLHNDYSERSFQLERGGQWVKGKSADTFAPVGPFLATRDEIPNPNNLAMWLKVNNEFRQNSNTSEMIFDVSTLISYVSEFMTLLPGDVISTGTPAGVGLGMDPPQYLKPGDVVNLGIERLGESQQRIGAWQA